MSIATKLAKLKTIKQDIKSALEEKGQTPSNVFSTYANNIRAIESGGVSSEGVTIPPISNLVISESGVASWDEPDISSLAEYNPIISYIVNVNGTEVEVDFTKINISSLLSSGSNNINVKTKAILNKNSNVNNGSIEISSSVEAIVTLGTTLPSSVSNISSISYGTDIYLFEGNKNVIRKFDSSSETITTLSTTLPYTYYQYLPCLMGDIIYIIPLSYSSSVKYILKFDIKEQTATYLELSFTDQNENKTISSVGNNAYIFGGYYSSYAVYQSSIYKFDSKNITYSIIKTTLPFGLSNASSCSVGNDIYIFGGQTGSSSYKNTILKFDTITETITTLETTIPTTVSNHICINIYHDIYIFGGYNVNALNTIYKFNVDNLTCEVSNIVLPIAMYRGAVSSVGKNAFIFGGANNNNKIIKYTAGL